MTRIAPGDLIGLGLLGVRTRKARATLSALGIAIGIATLVVVTGIPASSRQALDRQLAALGTNRLQAAPVPDRDPPVMLPAESVDMVARIAPVTVASAVADFGQTVARSDRTGAGDFNALAVLAAKNNLLQAVNGRVRAGRFLDPAVEHFPTVVLGSVAAARLGFADLAPGQKTPQVFIGRHWFTVIGILEPVPLSPDLDRSVLIGWDAAGKWLRFGGHPTRIYLQTTDDQVEAVRGVLAATVDPEHPGDVLVSRPSDALGAKRAVERTFGALFLGLAGIALLVGGIGVANTMYISVLERRREIGLRRALGANRGQVRVQFLTESIVLSVLGGAAGVLGGVLATAAYCAWQDWPLVVPGRSTAGGLTGALAIGVLAGVYPAIRAARLHPTEALSSV
ncbi:ABC transporter permease [Actinoplanes sp. KI2]|uniref:ABC transporter permease n=1 Tax=Actinoplanes sp. KI2 TaxID=2983315 RepID=UPI0021D5AF94|nr:ABC transporter permease [Actinoplanes sp. KI2]MCU7724959.1 ABC transporter permease [Actinoplanes sp. KI2]